MPINWLVYVAGGPLGIGVKLHADGQKNFGDGEHLFLLRSYGEDKSMTTDTCLSTQATTIPRCLRRLE